MVPVTYFRRLDEVWWRGYRLSKRVPGLANDGLRVVVLKYIHQFFNTPPSKKVASDYLPFECRLGLVTLF